MGKRKLKRQIKRLRKAVSRLWWDHRNGQEAMRDVLDDEVNRLRTEDIASHGALLTELSEQVVRIAPRKLLQDDPSLMAQIDELSERLAKLEQRDERIQQEVTRRLSHLGKPTIPAHHTDTSYEAGNLDWPPEVD